MKLIVAYVRASSADGLLRVIERAGLHQLSLARVHVVVRPPALSAGDDAAQENDSDVRLEAYCEDERADHVLALILEVGRIGPRPLGSVFVVPVERHAVIAPGVVR